MIALVAGSTCLVIAGVAVIAAEALWSVVKWQRVTPLLSYGSGGKNLGGPAVLNSPKARNTAESPVSKDAARLP